MLYVGRTGGGRHPKKQGNYLGDVVVIQIRNEEILKL